MEEHLVTKIADRKPWWHWFRVELPRGQDRKAAFFLALASMMFWDSVAGYVIGLALRGIFGWPF